MNPQTPGLPIQPPGSKRWFTTSVILAILLLASLIFGGWAYNQHRNDENNFKKSLATLTPMIQKAQQGIDQAAFDAQNKSPYKTFSGSATYGSVSLSYPKSWSAYVDATNTAEPINGYFHPDVVPSTQSDTAYALRLELVGTAYADVITNFQSQISDGSVKASAYIPPKMQGVKNVQAGMLLTGPISADNTQQGLMVVIKVRDKTLKIYTETNSFASDFNNIVLPSLTFAP